MGGAASGNRGALRWLIAIQLLSMGAMEMSAPFWALHLRSFGSLSAQALAWASSLAYAGPMVTAMCVAPLWGQLGDRSGHKPMLLRALIALAATQVWVALANDVATVLAARLVQGALAGFIAAAQAYGASLVAAGGRAGLMGKLQVAMALGSIAGPLAGGALYDSVGFRTLNLAAAAICIACAAAAAIALPATRPQQATRAGAARQASRPFARGTLAGLLLAIVLVQTGKMMPQAFFGLYAEQVLRIPSWVSGLCYGATALGLCIGAPFWGKRFDGQPRAVVLRQVEAVSWACAAVVALQALTDDLTLFILARVGWGVCLGALLPVFYGLLSREAGAGEQGRVLGAGNSAAKAGALLGAGAGGLALALMPLAYLFWPVAAVYALAGIGLRFIRRAPEQAQAEPDAIT